MSHEPTRRRVRQYLLLRHPPLQNHPPLARPLHEPLRQQPLHLRISIRLQRQPKPLHLIVHAQCPQEPVPAPLERARDLLRLFRADRAHAPETEEHHRILRLLVEPLHAFMSPLLSTRMHVDDRSHHEHGRRASRRQRIRRVALELDEAVDDDAAELFEPPPVVHVPLVRVVGLVEHRGWQREWV
ncbi:hypothetical protein QJS10_CPB11g01685 [Acorus calamus]|uniref:Uncharacterized protein n=1 Tax=Acorus calamus TaxID=4465 RepID=A0AAV9DWS7_ACOCL|nr:hypothetical protein QJS10_CPB11g01685 [Acorus calamus]